MAVTALKEAPNDQQVRGFVRELCALPQPAFDALKEKGLLYEAIKVFAIGGRDAVDEFMADHGIDRSAT